jgi:hypothetical protein
MARPKSRARVTDHGPLHMPAASCLSVATQEQAQEHAARTGVWRGHVAMGEGGDPVNPAVSVHRCIPPRIPRSLHTVVVTHTA